MTNRYAPTIADMKGIKEGKYPGQYELAEYDVTWSRKDRYCADQYADETPEEFPTAPVATTMKQIDSEVKDEFSRFNFDREVKW